MLQWTTRQLSSAVEVRVGPCAWRVTLLPDQVQHVRERPSLIVISPDDPLPALAAAAPHLGDLPVMLVVNEPVFARQFAAAIEDRMTALERERVEILCLRVEDPAELKSGSLLQTLYALREEGRAGNLGLSTTDVRSAEWLAMHTAVRVLQLPWSEADQSARHRALPAAREHGMTCIGMEAPAADAAFLLAAAEWVLPVLDSPLPEVVAPWSPQLVEESWVRYQREHPPPPPLPRSHPPTEE